MAQNTFQTLKLPRDWQKYLSTQININTQNTLLTPKLLGIEKCLSLQNYKKCAKYISRPKLSMDRQYYPSYKYPKYPSIPKLLRTCYKVTKIALKPSTLKLPRMEKLLVNRKFSKHMLLWGLDLIYPKRKLSVFVGASKDSSRYLHCLFLVFSLYKIWQACSFFVLASFP